MAKNNKRRSVVEYDTDDGLRVKITVETFNNHVLTYSEQKSLQEHMVDQAVFSVRGAPYLGCPPVQRCKIT